jgi:hypothetical protein
MSAGSKWDREWPETSKLVAPTGSNWQHRPQISRNGWKGFDFGLEVGPSYFCGLELIEFIKCEILPLRYAQGQNDGQRLRLKNYLLLSLKKMVGFVQQTTNSRNAMIILIFHHSQKKGISSRAAEF